MTVYMPPLTRKKRVPDKYNPDTFRVISTAAEEQHPYFPTSLVDVHERCYDELRKEGHTPYVYSRSTEVLPHTMPDYRAHRPHPENADFLRSNVMMLNEPICGVKTAATQEEQNNWWPSRTSDTPRDNPPYTINTTFRDDFRQHKPGVAGATRHSSNPNTQPSIGTAPVTQLRESDGKQRLWKEGFSYEHQYNCRLDPSYPIRSKRHGAFVWNKMKPEDAQRFIDYHSGLNEQERIAACQNSQQIHCPAGSHDVNWPAEIADKPSGEGTCNASAKQPTPSPPNEMECPSTSNGIGLSNDNTLAKVDS